MNVKGEYSISFRSFNWFCWKKDKLSRFVHCTVINPPSALMNFTQSNWISKRFDENCSHSASKTSKQKNFHQQIQFIGKNSLKAPFYFICAILCASEKKQKLFEFICKIN